MKRAFAFLKNNLLAPLVCFGAALALMQTPLLQRVEDLTLDERTKLRSRMEVTLPADEIALLAIDEPSVQDVGRWPWDRAVHGHLMELLSQVRPAVVAWDILFTEESPQDPYFARALAKNRAVVLGAMRGVADDDGVSVAEAHAAGVRLEPLAKITGDRRRIPAAGTLVAPSGALGRVASIGFVDTPPGDDGVRRAAPLLVRVGDEVFPTLSLQALMKYWAAEPENVTVRLGDAVIIEAPLARRRIPIDESGAYAINYRHGPNGFTRYGYTSVLTELSRRYEKKEPVGVTGLSGRIVLVGQVADGLTDFGPTPFAPLTPLVLVHANVIENVLRSDYVRHLPGWIVWGGGLCVSMAGLARFSNRRPVAQAAFAFGVPVAFVGAAFLAWVNGSVTVPLVGPLLGFAGVQAFMIGRRMLAEMRAKEQIKGMFGTYVSPELVRRLVAAGRQPELGGHQEEVTAYFSDIEQFSTFSELLPPARLVELMNEYLTVCTDIVQGEGGTLDKYVGDAVVAMFGAPVALPDHAYRACTAVALVQQKMEVLRARWKAEGRWPEIVGRMRTRIGLNTGPCVVGNIGSRMRFNYTMMGDNVNLAARMESGAKSWGTYAMCTEATRLACEAHGAGRIVFRPLGRIKVKGRATPVPIHEIVGAAETLGAEGRECIAVFGQALERYYERDWDRADTLFQRAAMLEPLQPDPTAGVSTNPSLVYAALVRQMRLQPPPEGWDGVFVMSEK